MNDLYEKNDHRLRRSRLTETMIESAERELGYKLHSRAYFNEVNGGLTDASSRDEVMERMVNTAIELQPGGI